MNRSISQRVAGLVALAVVGALGVTVWAWSDGGEDSRPSAGRPSAPSPTHAQPPQSLRDLPRGTPAHIPYVTGRVPTLGNRRVELRRRPTTVVDSAFAVVVRYRDGSVELVTEPSLKVRRLADSSGSSPIVDPGSNFVAWLTPDPGSAAVVLHALRGAVPPLDRQSFPAVPKCCDGSFQILGMSQYGELYTSWPAVAADFNDPRLVGSSTGPTTGLGTSLIARQDLARPVTRRMTQGS